MENWSGVESSFGVANTLIIPANLGYLIHILALNMLKIYEVDVLNQCTGLMSVQILENVK